MSTLKVTNLQHPSAAAANVTLDSSGNAAFSGGISGVTSVNGGQLGALNLIQNGAVAISQRGTSFSPPTTGAYVVDRFHQYQGGGGVLYYEQSTDAPAGFSNSLKVTVNTADTSIASSDFYFMRQNIEGLNCTPLSLGTSDAVTFTLSFYVKSSLTGTFNGCFQNGAADRSYVYEYTINAANTWERKTVTLVGDTTGTWFSDNRSGLRVTFDFGMGSSFNTTANSWQTGNYHSTSGTVKLVGTAGATWQITGVMLETGDTATSYPHEDYGTTLQKCQRYYQRIYYTYEGNFGASGNGAPHETALPVSLRGNPSITSSEITKGGTVSALSSIDAKNTGSAGAPLYTYLNVALIFSGAGYGYYLAYVYADAEL